MKMLDLLRSLFRPKLGRPAAVLSLVIALLLGIAASWTSYTSSSKVSSAEDHYGLLGAAPTCDLVEVLDGRTLKLDCGWDAAQPDIYTIELHCIDVPLLSQAGVLARDHLSRITSIGLAIKPVRYYDRNRLSALVYSNGRELGAQMVRDGFGQSPPGGCGPDRPIEGIINNKAT